MNALPVACGSVWRGAAAQVTGLMGWNGRLVSPRVSEGTVGRVDQGVDVIVVNGVILYAVFAGRNSSVILAQAGSSRK